MHIKCYIDQLRDCTVEILRLRRQDSWARMKAAQRDIETIDKVLAEKGGNV